MINCVIGLPVGISIQDGSPAVGLAAVFAGFFGVFGGILCLVGQDENGYRRPKLYPLGLIFFFLPTGFVVDMAIKVFFT